MLPFLTSYDPLGGSSGSIDPLGALQTYGMLADLLLPGLTTITTRSRYLSMVCAALAGAEMQGKLLPGASGVAQRRKQVEPFERLWALACVAARDDGHEGAAAGLRGITYAEANYKQFSAKGGNVNCDFQLLRSQSRTGAVGTYWTALSGGLLVEAGTASLTYEGRELAREFPELRMEGKDRARLANPQSASRVSISLEDLRAWGDECHLQAAGPVERRQLGEALTADDRRECVKWALLQQPEGIPIVWDTDAFARLRKILVTLPRAVDLGLPAVVDAIIATEQFHEAVLVAFDTLLWWGTIHAEMPVADLIDDDDFRKAVRRCRETASNLRAFRERSEAPVHNAIEGLAGFCFSVDHCRSELEFVDELLGHHHRVQSGKFNGGMPKRDWISRDHAALLRTSLRFQRDDRPGFATGVTLTHPYRLEAFVYMLRENEVIPYGE